jgi:hypothetical protein
MAIIYVFTKYQWIKYTTPAGDSQLISSNDHIAIDSVVLVMEETGIHGENHRQWASNW